MKYIKLEDLQRVLQKNAIETGGKEVKPEQLGTLIENAHIEEDKKARKSGRIDRIIS